MGLGVQKDTQMPCWLRLVSVPNSTDVLFPPQLLVLSLRTHHYLAVEDLIVSVCNSKDLLLFVHSCWR